MTSQIIHKSVYGYGINDMPGFSSIKKNGKIIPHPAYVRWKAMLKRCYSSKFHEKNPTYIGCTVAKEWLTLSNFIEWLTAKQGWEYLQLDKDLLSPGNKVYCPESCMLVPQHINSLLCDCGATRGKYPQGVSLKKRRQKFQATININGKQKHIGYFASQDEASIAYKEAKSKHVIYCATKQLEPLRSALIHHANMLLKS